MKRFFLIFLCNALFLSSYTQNELLTWKDHFSYKNVICVTGTNDAVYAATSLGAFRVSLEDNSITRINKANDLSDIGISCLEGIPERDMLLVGYDNGNLDIMLGNKFINLSDVKESSLRAAKRINSIDVKGDFAFLCTEFGIIQLDLVRLEIKDTYLIGENGAYVNVFDLEIVDGRILAATDRGVFEAEENNSFLANFESWTLSLETPSLEGRYENITSFNGRLYIHEVTAEGEYVYSTSLSIDEPWEEFWFDEVGKVREIKRQNNQLFLTTKGIVQIYDQDLQIVRSIEFLGPGWTDSYQAIPDPLGNGFWVANNRDGLFHVLQGSAPAKIIPNGPRNSAARKIRSYFEDVWCATGGVRLGYVNNWSQNGINYYVNNKWNSITRETEPLMDGENEYGNVAFDMMDVAIDPSNPDRVYVSSWDEGVYEILNGEIIEIHNTTNSPLVGVNEEFNNEIVYVDGLAFDNDENLWVTNSKTADCLHVLTPGGQWYSFNFEGAINETFVLGDVIIDSGTDRGDYIWVTLPKGNGVLVFDYGDSLSDTSDDRYKILGTADGEGALPSDDVYSISSDVNGEIWIGTLQGIGVFYDTECIFTDDLCDAQQILIEQDGNFQLLLETETITSIEVDGGNRKWIGTQTSGVYLLSADGIDQIYRFTEDNSPLISNTIQDISFNFSTGEIFFATDEGVVSFIGTATGFDGKINEASIYPNPVRADYNGVITIDGLTFRTDVKITDINGTVVHSTTSEGGRALWNGKNENGERVSTGVYLVFATNRDGSETTVGKIAVVN